MGKIAQVSIKYIIHATLKADGIVDRPDIIGAIFGQTEGLLGSDMELRELQKSGRIGRINVVTFDKNGKTTAKIEIPTSLDKTKTAIIAAAIETITRIGPCDGKITLDKIEDVRNEKRDYIQERAKEILSKFIKETEDSVELTREVSDSVKAAEVITYGPDKLFAGPDVDSSDELIIVEGRADVIVLLKAGIKNVISVNGTNIPKTLIDLMKKKKTIIAFVDGDRGGDLIVKSLSQVGHIDFVAKAPDGKEVEELTSKEVLQCLRAKTPYIHKPSKPRRAGVSSKLRTFFSEALSEIDGKGVARLFNENLELLGEVPVSELRSVRGLSDLFAVVVDAPISDEVLFFAKDNGASYLVGSKLETHRRSSVKILTRRTLN